MKAGLQIAPVNAGDNLGPLVERVPLSRLVAYFLRLGTVGFGGPIALVGYMQRDLVEDRHWVSTEDYLQGLAFSQLSPGPLAAQLANYLGWVHSGTLGATLAGIAFVLPSLLMVLALAAMYVHFGQLAWIQGMFYGIGAAVSAIIVRSAWRLIQRTLGKDYLLWTVFAILTITTVWTESEFLSLFILAGFVSMLIKAPPTGRGTFSRAVISPVGLVGLYAPAGTKSVMTVQFLDAVAIAMITPGPVVITSGFIGYLVAGPLGAIAATVAVFLPPYLLVVFGAPYYRRFAKNRQVKAFVQGVTAAAVGAIAGAAIILSKRAVIDLPTILIAVVSLVLLLRFKKIPEPLIILAAGIVGMTVKRGWS